MLATGVTAKQAVRLRQAPQRICLRRIQKSVFHKRAWILTKKPATGAGFSMKASYVLHALQIALRQLCSRSARILGDHLLQNAFYLVGMTQAALYISELIE